MPFMALAHELLIQEVPLVPEDVPSRERAVPRAQDLLRSMYPRIQVNQWNWPAYLADKLKLHWKETNNHKFAPLPFAIPRATDASWHYSRLPTDQRCVV